MPTASPVLDHLNVVVADMAASVAFYRLLGLEIDDTTPFAAHHCEAKMPEGHLALDSMAFAKEWGWRGNAAAGRAVIGFRVLSRAAVDDVYARLTSVGYVGQLAPCDRFWGARYAIVEDPDGNPVGLMSPIDPAKRTEPPAM